MWLKLSIAVFVISLALLWGLTEAVNLPLQFYKGDTTKLLMIATSQSYHSYPVPYTLLMVRAGMVPVALVSGGAALVLGLGYLIRQILRWHREAESHR